MCNASLLHAKVIKNTLCYPKIKAHLVWSKNWRMVKLAQAILLLAPCSRFNTNSHAMALLAPRYKTPYNNGGCQNVFFCSDVIHSEMCYFVQVC